jgi:hypothetical protein
MWLAATACCVYSIGSACTLLFISFQLAFCVVTPLMMEQMFLTLLRAVSVAENRVTAVCCFNICPCF